MNIKNNDNFYLAVEKIKLFARNTFPNINSKFFSLEVIYHDDDDFSIKYFSTISSKYRLMFYISQHEKRISEVTIFLLKKNKNDEFKCIEEIVRPNESHQSLVQKTNQNIDCNFLSK